MITSFNSRDYYCVEYRGANDMTESEMEEIARKNRNNYSLEAYKEYVKKYYPKKEHKQMIKDYKEKLK